MNALAQLHQEPRRGGGTPEVTWDELVPERPRCAATMASYLDQLAVSSRPSTVDAVELALRLFVSRVTSVDPTCRAVARHRAPPHRGLQVLAGQPGRGRGGKPLSTHDDPAPARLRAHLLRTPHRIGRRRRPGARPHLPERLPSPRRAAAQVLGRPDGGQVHGRTGRSTPTGAVASWSSCWPAPACAWAS